MCIQIYIYIYIYILGGGVWRGLPRLALLLAPLLHPGEPPSKVPSIEPRMDAQLHRSSRAIEAGMHRVSVMASCEEGCHLWHCHCQHSCSQAKPPLDPHLISPKTRPAGMHAASRRGVVWRGMPHLAPPLAPQLHPGVPIAWFYPSSFPCVESSIAGVEPPRQACSEPVLGSCVERDATSGTVSGTRAAPRRAPEPGSIDRATPGPTARMARDEAARHAHSELVSWCRVESDATPGTMSGTAPASSRATEHGSRHRGTHGSRAPWIQGCMAGVEPCIQSSMARIDPCRHAYSE